MARYLDAKCKLCRREGEKLFLKGARCHTVKCAIARRAYIPGMHAFRRSRPTDYGNRLREKQKTKRYYGVTEKQFRIYFREAERLKGNTGENLLMLLERRLDNVICHMGFASSRAQARQLITHGHILVNGKKVDVPSYLVKIGLVITPKSRAKSQNFVKERLEARKGDTPPAWLAVDQKKMEGQVMQKPSREDVALPINEAFIVEFCSR